MFKKFVLRRLQKYVQKYFQKHPEVKLVVVTGSVGKTSTKRAIATIASQKLRVRMEAGNYNTEYSAPLGILGIEYPGRIKSVLAWLSVFRAARRRIRQVTDVDVIVQELGADHPGDIKAFGEYLRPDIVVVTGVTPEHMEYFGNLDKVAEEELAAANFSALALINRDEIDE
jgi:UDP-N-acetylmuramoyl-tripeptide--D-alanyl-D-alanine ligase